MIQSLLSFFAPAQGVPVIPSFEPKTDRGAALGKPFTRASRPGGLMATRAQAPVGRNRSYQVKNFLLIAGNALGLVLYMAGLGLILRLAEVLLT